MTTKPTHIIYLVQDTGKKTDNGKDLSTWKKIGAVFKNKTGNGSAISWDFEPVPTNGRTYILPYEERQKEEQP